MRKHSTQHTSLNVSLHFGAFVCVWVCLRGLYVCECLNEWVCGVTALMCNVRAYVTNITMRMELRLQQIVCSISLLLWATTLHIVHSLLILTTALIPVSTLLGKTQHITYTPYESEQPPMKVKSNQTSFNFNIQWSTLLILFVIVCMSPLIPLLLFLCLYFSYVTK